MTQTYNLTGKKIAMVATHGFEQSELLGPKEQLEQMGAEITVISIDDNTSIKGWDEKDWGKSVNVDVQIGDARLSDYDALVLPGGQMNPDILRANEQVVNFITQAYIVKNIKAIAAICHAPWLLIEAGLVKNKSIASFPSIKTDVINAGATWVDESVVCDGKLITSRNPNDIDNFVEKIATSMM